MPPHYGFAETFVRADGAFIPFADDFDISTVTTVVRGVGDIGDVKVIDLQCPLNSLIGRQVCKVGRSSGHTTGTVMAYALEYNDEKGICFFTDILVVGENRQTFDLEGDSGSLIILTSQDGEKPRPIGIIWGGTANRGRLKLTSDHGPENWTSGVDLGRLLDRLELDIIITNESLQGWFFSLYSFAFIFRYSRNTLDYPIYLMFSYYFVLNLYTFAPLQSWQNLPTIKMPCSSKDLLWWPPLPQLLGSLPGRLSPSRKRRSKRSSSHWGSKSSNCLAMTWRPLELKGRRHPTRWSMWKSTSSSQTSSVCRPCATTKTLRGASPTWTTPPRKNSPCRSIWVTESPSGSVRTPDQALTWRNEVQKVLVLNFWFWFFRVYCHCGQPKVVVDQKTSYAVQKNWTCSKLQWAWMALASISCNMMHYYYYNWFSPL